MQITKRNIIVSEHYNNIIYLLLKFNVDLMAVPSCSVLFCWSLIFLLYLEMQKYKILNVYFISAYKTVTN